MKRSFQKDKRASLYGDGKAAVEMCRLLKDKLG